MKPEEHTAIADLIKELTASLKMLEHGADVAIDSQASITPVEQASNAIAQAIGQLANLVAFDAQRSNCPQITTAAGQTQESSLVKSLQEQNRLIDQREEARREAEKCRDEWEAEIQRVGFLHYKLPWETQQDGVVYGPRSKTQFFDDQGNTVGVPSA